MNSQPVFTAFCIYKGSNTYSPKTSDTPNTLSTSNVSAADAAKSCQIEANQNGTSRSTTEAMKLDNYNLWLQAQCVQIALVGRVTSYSFRHGALQGIMGRGGTQRAASLAYHKDLRISKKYVQPFNIPTLFRPVMDYLRDRRKSWTHAFSPCKTICSGQKQVHCLYETR
jgi:hypothetical protein